MKKTAEKYQEKTTAEREEATKNLSRRNFLNTAGIVAVGGLVTVAGGSLLAEREAEAAATPEAPPLPWKYVKLDPLEAGKRGYKNYLEKGG